MTKIADLELGDNGEQGDITSLHMSAENATTSSWQAPEVISMGTYTQASDVYSLGLVLWEIVATSKITYVNPQNAEGRKSSSAVLGKGGIPFAEYGSQTSIRQKIMDGERPLIPAGFGEQFSQLLQRSWHPDPAKRPTASEVAMEMYYCWVGVLHRLDSSNNITRRYHNTR